ncbi:phage tail protein [Enterobacter hormaechei]|uniref:phage tail protein n=1 Tax=Enterobacter hormaechei TaxID=158836 RepID=UPI002A765CC0|nr:phage tail protein [Enterobacter hormaechei]MDY3572307.1 phage tail protein [Enterobacter hormaechei]
MNEFYVLVTDAGAELEAAAHSAGVPVALTGFGVCDGGVDFIPDPALTTFANEVYHGPISSLTVSADDPAEIAAQCIIPADSGGYTIRGVAIFASDGTLYAVGNYAAQDKPPPDSGFAVSLEILVMLALSSTTDVILSVPDTTYLTEPRADTLYLRQDKRLAEIAEDGADAQAEARDNLALGSIAVAERKEFLQVAGTPLSVNLDTLGSSGSAGVYYQPANVNATPENNYPIAQAGTLIVTPSAYGCQQEYTAFTNGRKFFRALSGVWDGTSGPWAEWSEYYGPGHAPPYPVTSVNNKTGDVTLSAADVGALPSTGGTLDGNLTVKNTIQIGSVGSAVLNVGDSDSGLRSSKDGQVDLWSNNKSIGYWNGTTLYFIGQIIPVNYANFDARYYTQSAANAKFVTKTQLGTKGAFTAGGGTQEAPAGCVLTGGGDFGASDGSYFYRPMQYVINGAAYTAAYTATLQSVPGRQVNIREALPIHSIDELINCQLYNNTFLNSDETDDGLSLASLLDEQGFDFYQAQNNLAGTVFIAYEPDTGIIRQIDTDPQLMWPVDMNLRGLDALPDGCDIHGTWIYADGEVTQSTELLRARNKRILSSKLALVAGFGVMYQLLPEGTSPDEVQSLKDYIAELRSVDLDSNQPGWPEPPSFIL